MIQCSLLTRVRNLLPSRTKGPGGPRLGRTLEVNSQSLRRPTVRISEMAPFHFPEMAPFPFWPLFASRFVPPM